MAKATSDEELQLRKRARRRLVGAIALVLVVVVFLPMILDNEPRPLSEDIEISVPPLPAEDTASALPVPPPASAPEQAVQAEEPASPPVTKITPAPTPAPTPPRTETAIKPAPTPKPAGQQAALDEYVVQLGAFSNAANARQLASKVRENRFKAYTEVVNTANGDRTRVRVGPYPSKDAAEKARDRLKSLKLTLGEPAVLKADE